MPDSGCISRFRRSTSRPDAFPAARPSRSPGAADRRQVATVRWAPARHHARPRRREDDLPNAARLSAAAGEDRGEAVSTLLDKARHFPILVQHLELLCSNPTHGRTGHRGDGMGWADRSAPAHPEHPIGTVSQRWHLLEPLGPNPVPHQHPRWVRGSIHPERSACPTRVPGCPAAHQRPAARGGGGGPSGPLPGGHARTPDRTLGRRVSRDHLQETWRPPLMS
jgi:hypothetical protein